MKETMEGLRLVGLVGFMGSWIPFIAGSIAGGEPSLGLGNYIPMGIGGALYLATHTYLVIKRQPHKEDKGVK